MGASAAAGTLEEGAASGFAEACARVDVRVVAAGEWIELSSSRAA